MEQQEAAKESEISFIPATNENTMLDKEIAPETKLPNVKLHKSITNFGKASEVLDSERDESNQYQSFDRAVEEGGESNEGISSGYRKGSGSSSPEMVIIEERKAADGQESDNNVRNFNHGRRYPHYIARKEMCYAHDARTADGKRLRKYESNWEDEPAYIKASVRDSFRSRKRLVRGTGRNTGTGGRTYMYNNFDYKRSDFPLHQPKKSSLTYFVPMEEKNWDAPFQNFTRQPQYQYRYDDDRLANNKLSDHPLFQVPQYQPSQRGTGREKSIGFRSLGTIESPRRGFSERNHQNEENSHMNSLDKLTLPLSAPNTSKSSQVHFTTNRSTAEEDIAMLSHHFKEAVINIDNKNIIRKSTNSPQLSRNKGSTWTEIEIHQHQQNHSTNTSQGDKYKVDESVNVDNCANLKLGKRYSRQRQKAGLLIKHGQLIGQSSTGPNLQQEQQKQPTIVPKNITAPPQHEPQPVAFQHQRTLTTPPSTPHYPTGTGSTADEDIATLVQHFREAVINIDHENLIRSTDNGAALTQHSRKDGINMDNKNTIRSTAEEDIAMLAHHFKEAVVNIDNKNIIRKSAIIPDVSQNKGLKTLPPIQHDQLVGQSSASPNQTSHQQQLHQQQKQSTVAPPTIPAPPEYVPPTVTFVHQQALTTPSATAYYPSGCAASIFTQVVQEHLKQQHPHQQHPLQQSSNACQDDTYTVDESANVDLCGECQHSDRYCTQRQRTWSSIQQGQLLKQSLAGPNQQQPLQQQSQQLEQPKVVLSPLQHVTPPATFLDEQALTTPSPIAYHTTGCMGSEVLAPDQVQPVEMVTYQLHYLQPPFIQMPSCQIPMQTLPLSEPEIYQEGGTTYYNTLSQISNYGTTRSSTRRLKIAIPIIDPADDQTLEGRNEEHPHSP